MNEHDQELEALLAKATPLPCSVDPLQLMFDAGVEQQKRKSASARLTLVITSALSVFFLVTTLSFAMWSYSLTKSNNQLLARMNAADSESQLNGTKEGPDQSGLPEATVGKSPSSRGTNKKESQVDASIQLTFVDQASTALPGSEFGDKAFLLRGVSLRPQDEFKEARQSFSEVSSAEDPADPQSAPLNIRLRPTVNPDFYGP